MRTSLAGRLTNLAELSRRTNGFSLTAPHEYFTVRWRSLPSRRFFRWLSERSDRSRNLACRWSRVTACLTLSTHEVHSSCSVRDIFRGLSLFVSPIEIENKTHAPLFLSFCPSSSFNWPFFFLCLFHAPSQKKRKYHERQGSSSTSKRRKPKTSGRGPGTST